MRQLLQLKQITQHPSKVQRQTTEVHIIIKSHHTSKVKTTSSVPLTKCKNNLQKTSSL